MLDGCGKRVIWKCHYFSNCIVSICSLQEAGKQAAATSALLGMQTDAQQLLTAAEVMQNNGCQRCCKCAAHRHFVISR